MSLTPLDRPVRRGNKSQMLCCGNTTWHVGSYICPLFVYLTIIRDLLMDKESCTLGLFSLPPSAPLVYDGH